MITINTNSIRINTRKIIPKVFQVSASWSCLGLVCVDVVFCCVLMVFTTDRAKWLIRKLLIIPLPSQHDLKYGFIWCALYSYTITAHNSRFRKTLITILVKWYTFLYILANYWLAIYAHKSVHTPAKHQGKRSMGKDWTKEKLQQVSMAMMKSGQWGYEKFRELLVSWVNIICKRNSPSTYLMINSNK